METSPCTLLIDNGSYRAQSTLSLRRIAAELSEASGVRVHPVSLLHSTKVDPAELDGEPAQIFEPFVKRHLESGEQHSFHVVPLFFGHTAAIFEYLPQRVMDLQKDWPELEVRVSPCLVDLDDPADTGTAEILAELVRRKIAEENLDHPAVTLVDHGTPRIAVNQVRNLVAAQLGELLRDEARAVEASSMERREEPEYDFNEPLLENVLGTEHFSGDVVLSMLFMSPGRHAGPGGDIAQICEAAEKENPGLKTHMSDLFATHPGLVDLLAKRLRQGRDSEPVKAEIAPPAAVVEA